MYYLKYINVVHHFKNETALEGQNMSTCYKQAYRTRFSSYTTLYVCVFIYYYTARAYVFNLSAHA